MTDDAHVELDDQVRAGVARVMALLLPGTETLPSATAVAAHDELLDRVLRADPTLTPLVHRAGELGVMGITRFEELTAQLGADTERLVFALQAAYYMSAEVRERLGYPGQARVPVSLATPDQLCSDELIEPVEARGPIYVPTPVEE